MRRKPVNLPASIAAGLRRIAREKGTDTAFLLRRYAIERLLYRLSLSPHRNAFILKGAMLFTAWLDDPFRPTQDLDLLGLGDHSLKAITNMFRGICSAGVEDDGLRFDVAHLNATAIREDQNYGGVRVKTVAYLGKARIPVQVDIGFGDAVTPAAVEIEFPTLFDGPSLLLASYPRETVVAEKFEAMVKLGQANSRMKDYYDILALAQLFPFEGQLLADAFRATFARRKTELPSGVPAGLSDAFGEDALKIAQWAGFTGRAALPIPPGTLRDAVGAIRAFIMPPALAAREGDIFASIWYRQGPWQEKAELP